MSLRIGSQEINGLAAFVGWNSIQKKIRMRDRSLSSMIYDFYVDGGEAILSNELSVLEAETLMASNITIDDGGTIKQ